MGLLIFHCPASGARILTGIHTDAGSLAKVRSLSVKVYCPACKTTHLIMAGHGEVESVIVPQCAPIDPHEPENPKGLPPLPLRVENPTQEQPQVVAH